MVVYQQTINIHMTPERLTDGWESNVSMTLQNPSFVCVGTTNPGYLSFINHEISSPRGGSPFVVFVDPESSPAPVVASFGYRRDFKDMANHTILWSKEL